MCRGWSKWNFIKCQHIVSESLLIRDNDINITNLNKMFHQFGDIYCWAFVFYFRFAKHFAGVFKRLYWLLRLGGNCISTTIYKIIKAARLWFYFSQIRSFEIILLYFFQFSSFARTFLFLLYFANTCCKQRVVFKHFFLTFTF